MQILLIGHGLMPPAEIGLKVLLHGKHSQPSGTMPQRQKSIRSMNMAFQSLISVSVSQRNSPPLACLFVIAIERLMLGFGRRLSTIGRQESFSPDSPVSVGICHFYRLFTLAQTSSSGKTTFLWYLLVCLLQKKQVVLFHLPGIRPLLFYHDQVHFGLIGLISSHRH